jgi:predicted hydrocarbon binding protein
MILEKLFETKSVLNQEVEGELRDTLTGARVMIFSCSAYRSMCDTLFDRFESAAGTILYGMGQGYGSKLFRSISKLGLSSEDVIEALSKLASGAGWGILSVKIVDDGDAVCTVAKSPFVLRRTDCGPTTCYFLSGIFAALGTELMGGNIQAREVDCAAGGSSVCRFHLSRA